MTVSPRLREPGVEGSYAGAGRYREILRRARSLGAGAPVRAAYELSKHTGGHRAVFMILARRSERRRKGGGSAPSLNGLQPTAVPEARGRAISGAETICADGPVVFGTKAAFEAGQSWHAVLERPGMWPIQPWWRIDIRSPNRMGDVKWTWELGRQAHVVLLARAVAVTGRSDLQAALHHQLRTFMDENPVEVGVHWYSNLELGIRTLRWVEILSQVTLPPDLERRMCRHLGHIQAHLVAELPYTLSTMRNNHLLGDALGLSASARVTGAKWARVLGTALFDWQLGHHLLGGGRMIEDSLSYHRFVLEMLAWQQLLTTRGNGYRDKMVESAQALARLGVLAGPVPQYGDWDEGRMLVTSQSADRLDGTVCAALALGGTGSPTEWRTTHDECAWYTGPGDPVPPDAAVTDGSDVGLGIARGTAGVFVTWLKAGTGPSHGHADLCSVSVMAHGRWIVGDPGTGTYNGPREVRDYFRTSKAHAVIRVGGVDQLEPVGVFGWRYQASGVTGTPVPVPGGVLAWGAHDAYCRLRPRRRVARTVVTLPDLVVVADWVEGGEFQYELSLPLGPDATVGPSGAATNEVGVAVGGSRYLLILPTTASAVRGQEQPFAGWWSTTYGSWSPAWLLQMAGSSVSPVVWAITVPGGRRPVVRHDDVSIGDFSYRVVWTPLGPSVVVSGGAVRQATLALRRA